MVELVSNLDNTMARHFIRCWCWCILMRHGDKPNCLRMLDGPYNSLAQISTLNYHMTHCHEIWCGWLQMIFITSELWTTLLETPGALNNWWFSAVFQLFWTSLVLSGKTLDQFAKAGFAYFMKAQNIYQGRIGCGLPSDIWLAVYNRH